MNFSYVHFDAKLHLLGKTEAPKHKPSSETCLFTSSSTTREPIPRQHCTFAFNFEHTLQNSTFLLPFGFTKKTLLEVQENRSIHGWRYRNSTKSRQNINASESCASSSRLLQLRRNVYKGFFDSFFFIGDDGSIDRSSTLTLSKLSPYQSPSIRLRDSRRGMRTCHAIPCVALIHLLDPVNDEEVCWLGTGKIVGTLMAMLGLFV